MSCFRSKARVNRLQALGSNYSIRRKVAESGADAAIDTRAGLLTLVAIKIRFVKDSLRKPLYFHCIKDFGYVLAFLYSLTFVLCYDQRGNMYKVISESCNSLKP